VVLFASLYVFDILFCNCSDSVVLFASLYVFYISCSNTYLISGCPGNRLRISTAETHSPLPVASTLKELKFKMNLLSSGPYNVNLGKTNSFDIGYPSATSEIRYFTTFSYRG
jgi:hypothetical protein